MDNITEVNDVIYEQVNLVDSKFVILREATEKKKMNGKGGYKEKKIKSKPKYKEKKITYNYTGMKRPSAIK